MVRVLARSAWGPGFESRSDRAFSSSVTFVALCGFVLGLRAAKGLSRWFPAWFLADSRTNLFKQGGNDTGLPCGQIAQLSESSHGL